MSRLLLTVLAAASLLVAGCAAPLPTAASGATLQAFANDSEIEELFKRWQDERARRMEEERARRQALSKEGKFFAPPAAKAAAKPAPAQRADSITNVQHTGVDEGGIVKLHGDHLVILRRGRLFTVHIGDANLRPIAAVEAFGPSIEPRGAWYDEMLIHRDTIVVIGYSYQRGGTEIGLFNISATGALGYRGTYHLRSNDYYSSRNYASRLIGDKLVFYSPLHLTPWGGDPFVAFPALRRWHAGVSPQDFKRIAPATRIYRTDEDLDPYLGIALHSVAICDLAAAEMQCESTAVLAPRGRVFYVSPTAVYVWTTTWRRGDATPNPASAVFRIPLDGSAPSALKVAGSPIDQFSFHEDENHHLNVLVRANGRGDAMWAAEINSGDLALLRVPLAHFGDGTTSATSEQYRALPRAAVGNALQSRYIGAYLLYGAGAGWQRAQRTLDSQVFALRYAAASPVHRVALAHGSDRIEALDNDAVVIGTDGRDLHFTTVKLAAKPEAFDRLTRENAAQGETRSHGFFYRSQGGQGLIGLPVIGGAQAAAQQLRRPSAAVLFVRNQSLRLSALGALAAASDAATLNDACRASCVDWYGNSRPLFVGERVFALMGYELVEGQVSNNAIMEIRRVSFAPGGAVLSR